MVEKTIEQIEKDRAVLFVLANSYAGDKYGYIACRLHHVCNALLLEVENPQLEYKELLNEENDKS